MAASAVTASEMSSPQATQTSQELQLPSAQALQSTEQMKLLNVVDELRAHGLGDITALPQLVVCGDQSSGKSSVLEALSGVPFPRKDGICTRFATEVILRRDKRVSMKVSIVPSGDMPKEDQERLQLFQHDITSKDDFAELFEKAKNEMGMADHKKSFFKSILRVEFRGPEQPQLTLVDLPGLIHARTGPQTKDDIQLVNDLVGSYLSNPRSVILAVVSANNDASNQIITEKVRDIDPQGKRALGIITKPDTVGHNAEGKWIKLANNEDVKFDLGWHVVKNLDSAMTDGSRKDRDDQEAEFFKNSNFSVLPSQNVGIANLRTRLSKVLFHQIQTTLPKLLEEIESRTRATKAVADKLGPGRTTTKEQEDYLIELSQSFYTICRDAISGNYDHGFFRVDMDESRRLCANLMNKHFEFANTLRKMGASWKLLDEHAEDEDGGDEGEEIRWEPNRTRAEAIAEACKVLQRSRGPELPGLSNPRLVGELFRGYSRPWESIARDHITDVWDSTKRFIELVLQYLTDDEVCDKILRYWLDPIMGERLEAANSKLDELLDVHKDHPMTTNYDFVENRRRIQQKRNGDGSSSDMDLVAAEEALDNMSAYYEVALKLFMDNVPTLAIQAPIVRRIPDMFSPKTVSSDMDVDTVQKIAGESVDKVRKRNEALERLKKLETGARICREYALRPRSSTRTRERSRNTNAGQDSSKKASEKNTDINLELSHSRPVSRGGPTIPLAPGQYPLPSYSDLHLSPSLGKGLVAPKSDAIRRPVSPGNSVGASSPSSVLQAAANKPVDFGSFKLPLFSPGASSSGVSTSNAPDAPSSNASSLPLDLGSSTSKNGTGFLKSNPPASSGSSPASGLYSSLNNSPAGKGLSSATDPSSSAASTASKSQLSLFSTDWKALLNPSSSISEGKAVPKVPALLFNTGSDSSSKDKESDLQKVTSKSDMLFVAFFPRTHAWDRNKYPPFQQIDKSLANTQLKGYEERFMSFGGHPTFEHYSPEELRLADYVDGYRYNFGQVVLSSWGL